MDNTTLKIFDFTVAMRVGLEWEENQIRNT